MRAFIREFREFITRGNVIDLAVGIVIGVAFTAVVNSFVDDILAAIVGAAVGEPNFNDLTLEVGDGVLRYGAFLTAVIQFVAIAAAVFFIVVKPVNALMERLSTPADEGTPDEERRHQELLAALDRLSSS
jgi:large conductance mechanosensitive channel